MIYALALPALLLIWTLSPFCIREGDRAEKNPLWATYPRRSINGNNPASQRVHEGGGFRFSAILTCLVMAAFGFSAARFGGEEVLPFAFAAQIAALMLVFNASERWLDIAEHGAEAMHGDSVTLDPAARAWLIEKDFGSYRDGEVWRMTPRGQDFENLTPFEFDAMLRKAEWRAKIVQLLAKW